MNQFLIRKLLRKIGYDATKAERFDKIEASTYAWETLFEHIKTIFSLLEKKFKVLQIVQIGANDTKNDDNFYFIHKTKKQHKILYIEPNPSCVKKLKKENKNIKNVEIASVAINKKNGNKKFYFFNKKKENQIDLSVFGSLIKKQVFLHKIKFNLKSKIISKKIEVCNLKTIFRKKNIPFINVILCDIEGYDYEVVNQVVNLGSKKPNIFVYEHNLLSRALREAGYKKLKKSGYSLVCGQYDTLALLKS